MLTAFFASTAAVLLAEIGDKTQLLTLLLATKFPKQRFSIIAGVFVASILNHLASAWLGVWLHQWLTDVLLAWVVGISFIAVGLWLLVPDKQDSNNNRWFGYGAFIATTVLFFIAEIGDKTQIATVLLAAKYNNIWAVVAGSVIGLMLANIPMVFLGPYLLKHIPVRTIRLIACVLFCGLGLLTLLTVFR